jgi:hypothetical protein
MTWERATRHTFAISLASFHEWREFHPMNFKASRLTSGNRIFPASVQVEGHQITYRKRRWFGSTEETINCEHISSLRAYHGMIFSSITIESSGGSQPIVINGLRKGDARKLEAAVKATQAPEKD